MKLVSVYCPSAVVSFQSVLSPLTRNACDEDLKIVKASIVMIIIFIDLLIVVVNGLMLMLMHKDKGACQQQRTHMMQRNMIVDLMRARIDALMDGKGECAIIDLDMTSLALLTLLIFG